VALSLAAMALLLSPCFAGTAQAASDAGALAALANQPKFLPVDQVFHVSGTAAGPNAVRLEWSIRAGYYLYRSRLEVGAANGIKLGTLQLPRGQIKMDPYFGREEIYRNAVTGLLPLERSSSAGRDVSLRVTYQGCADAGLCYPPVTKTVSVKLPPPGVTGGVAGPGSVNAIISQPSAASSQPGQFRFEALARSGGLLAMIGWFYLAGLALAFTPCVLPTVPILSGIIVGQGRQVTGARGLRGGRRAGPGRIPDTMDHRSVRNAVRGHGAVHARPLHRTDAGGAADARGPAEQPADGRHAGRRCADGGAIGAHRHDLRRAGPRWGASRHQRDR
jgi:thiol:disulfide interchange protein DsbD